MAALDVAADNLAATVDTITAEGGTATAYGATSPRSVGGRRPWTRWSPRSGHPTVVCNVAGIGGFFNTDGHALDRWEKILAVNLTGPFLVCRATLPHLLEHGGPSSTWPPTPR